MAKSGQSHSQTWQPVQASGFFSTATCSAFNARQRSGHNFTQMSQPLHQAALMSSLTTSPAAARGGVAARIEIEPQRGIGARRFRPGATGLESLAVDLAGLAAAPRSRASKANLRRDNPSTPTGRQAARYWRRAIRQVRGDGRRVKRVAFGDLVGDFGRRLACIIGHRADLAVAAGEGRHDAARVGDEHAGVRPQMIEPAQPLRPFERDQRIGFAFGDRRRPHLLAEAHMAEDDTAALGHAVHFALLDLKALFLADQRQRLGNHQHALTADADDHDIARGDAGRRDGRDFGSAGSADIALMRPPAGCSRTDTPARTACSRCRRRRRSSPCGGRRSISSDQTIAGQPRFMQDWQATQPAPRPRAASP